MISHADMHTIHAHQFSLLTHILQKSKRPRPWHNSLGPDSISRCHLTSIGNPIVEIRRSYDRLISTMGFPILVRRHLYIESGFCCTRTSTHLASCCGKQCLWWRRRGVALHGACGLCRSRWLSPCRWAASCRGSPPHRTNPNRSATTPIIP